MPRRQYVADLAAAVADIPITGISDVQPGGDDGEFTFTCVADGHSIKISALIPGKFMLTQHASANVQLAAWLTLVCRPVGISIEP